MLEKVTLHCVCRRGGKQLPSVGGRDKEGRINLTQNLQLFSGSGKINDTERVGVKEPIFLVSFCGKEQTFLEVTNTSCPLTQSKSCKSQGKQPGVQGEELGRRQPGCQDCGYAVQEQKSV